VPGHARIVSEGWLPIAAGSALAPDRPGHGVDWKSLESVRAV
jgi:hypothetical protein